MSSQTEMLRPGKARVSTQAVRRKKSGVSGSDGERTHKERGVGKGQEERVKGGEEATQTREKQKDAMTDRHQPRPQLGSRLLFLPSVWLSWQTLANTNEALVSASRGSSEMPCLSLKSARWRTRNVVFIWGLISILQS